MAEPPPVLEGLWFNEVAGVSRAGVLRNAFTNVMTDNWLIQPVRDALRDKAITGMSSRWRSSRTTFTSAAAAFRACARCEKCACPSRIFPALAAYCTDAMAPQMQ